MGMFDNQLGIWKNLYKGFSNNPNNRQLASTLKEGARQVAGLTVADIPLSAKEAYDSAQQGDYFNAGLSAAAVVPGIPSFVGMFGGASSKTADLLKLKEAQLLIQQGIPKEEVLKRTGWILDKNKPPKYEIPDNLSKFRFDFETIPERGSFSKNQQEALLGGLLEHPELFKAYPHLLDIRAKILKNPTWFPDPQNIAYLFKNPISKKESIEIYSKESEDALSSLLHEIQHSIQHKEGWQAGGTPKGTDETAYKAYKELAGEKEARLTQKRKNLTKEERIILFPQEKDPFGDTTR